jgi:hypothetical protein
MDHTHVIYKEELESIVEISEAKTWHDTIAEDRTGQNKGWWNRQGKNGIWQSKETEDSKG